MGYCFKQHPIDHTVRLLVRPDDTGGQGGRGVCLQKAIKWQGWIDSLFLRTPTPIFSLWNGMANSSRPTGSLR